VRFAQKFDSNRIRRLIREFFWIVFGQVSTVLGALVGIRVLTELMSPNEYGQLALGMTLATLAGQAWWGPLGAGVSRFFASASEAGELKPYLIGVGQLVFFVNKVMLLLAIAAAIFALVLGFEVWISIATAALVFVIVTGYNNIINGIQNAARQRAVVALHSGIASWIRLLIAVSLIFLFGVSSIVVIWGYVIATICILLSQYLFLKPILKTANHQQGATNKTSDVWKKRIISYSWPFATWGIFSAFHLSSDRWALAAFSSQSEVGLFSVLYQLGYYPVALFTEMLVSLISPILFQRAGDGASSERLNNAISLNIKIVGAVLLVTAFIFLVTWLAHELIFKIFVAKEYARISYLLPWLTLSAGVTSAGHVLSLARMSGLDTKALIAPKVVTALVGILLNLCGAYLYGLEGVVMGQFIYSIIYFGWMILQYLNYSRKTKLVLSD
jgi:O-antigen/teichoic acid export membrane protein